VERVSEDDWNDRDAGLHGEVERTLLEGAEASRFTAFPTRWAATPLGREGRSRRRARPHEVGGARGARAHGTRRTMPCQRSKRRWRSSPSAGLFAGAPCLG